MRLRRLLTDIRGFSLIEAIITVVIVGIITVPISTIYIGSLKDTVIAKEQLKATQLAQQCIENIKAKSDSDLWLFFNNDPDTSDGPEVRTITADQGYQVGFPNIPKGYKARISFETSTFDTEPYRIAGSTTTIDYDATISFNEDHEIGFEKSFIVDNGSEEDKFCQAFSTTDRIIYIKYQGDSDNVLIQDDSNADGNLTDFRIKDLSPLAITKVHYNLKILCNDERVPDYATKIYIINETTTPVNLYVYNSPLSKVNLSINDAEGYYQEGVIQTFYNMQADVEASHKIYVVRVQIYNEDNVLLSEIKTTKTEE